MARNWKCRILFALLVFNRYKLAIYYLLLKIRMFQIPASPLSYHRSALVIPSASPAIRVGSTISVSSGEVLTAKELLGEGSFGSVWRMEGGSRTLALKETISDSETAFQQSLSEALILQKVGEGIGLPCYFGHEAAGIERGKWRVRTLMTLIPGSVLDRWLIRHPTKVHSLTHAVSETRTLLVELARTLKSVDRVAVHRDVNSHNIMVREEISRSALGVVPEDGHLPDSPKTQSKFFLIDFGLAIEKNKWLGGVKSSTRNFSWETLPLAGDCKYWPPCAWQMFVFGPKGLTDPWLKKQYLERLDSFSLAVTALEFFWGILNGSAGSADFGKSEENLVSANSSISDHKSGNGKPRTALEGAREAWLKYWEATSGCWELFYATFKKKGDWDGLRRRLVEKRVFEQISHKLQKLLIALGDLGASVEGGDVFILIKDMLTAEGDPAGSFENILQRLGDKRLPSPKKIPCDFTRRKSEDREKTVPAERSRVQTPLTAVQPPTVGVNSAGQSFNPVLADFRSPIAGYRALPFGMTPQFSTRSPMPGNRTLNFAYTAQVSAMCSPCAQYRSIPGNQTVYPPSYPSYNMPVYQTPFNANNQLTSRHAAPYFTPAVFAPVQLFR